MNVVKFPTEPLKRLQDEYFEDGRPEVIPAVLEIDEYLLAEGIVKDVSGEGKHRVEIYSDGILFSCDLSAYACSIYGWDLYWNVFIEDEAFTVGEEAREITFRMNKKALIRYVEQNYRA